MFSRNQFILRVRTALPMIVLLVGLIANVAPANAQLSSGSILGAVTDSTGAVIPGVAVRVTNTGTGLSRDALTNESGNYRVDLLPPGRYQVDAEAGRNSLTGPSLWLVDLAALKAFIPAESQKIEFRLEFFNALNHPNYDDPATNWSATTFGQIPVAFASRQIQLGLKWVF